MARSQGTDVQHLLQLVSSNKKFQSQMKVSHSTNIVMLDGIICTCFPFVVISHTRVIENFDKCKSIGDHSSQSGTRSYNSSNGV